MKELSLNILDIVENSAKAGAKLITVSLVQSGGVLTLTVADDGCGMTQEILRRVTDPFYTTRTTRKVGLGLPLLQLAAEQTGGSMKIESRHRDEFPETHGTTVTAVFHTDSIDAPPIGDIVSTLVTVIQGHPDSDLLFTHKSETLDVTLDTREMREVLGDVPLSSPEVLVWAAENLREQYAADAQNKDGTVYL